MRLAVCLLASLLALWMTMEIDGAPGQWNFEPIIADIDQLVKELPISKFLLKRNLKGLAKKLRENPKEYREISIKLALLVNYAETSDFDLRMKMGKLLGAIRAQFVFGQPIAELAKIEGGLADAKRKLAGNKYNQVFTFHDLMDQVKEKIQQKYAEFMRHHWLALWSRFPQFVGDISRDIANFKPKWVSEEEFGEIEKATAQCGNPFVKRAFEQLHALRHAINMLVEEEMKGVDENIQQMASTNPEENLTGDAMKYEHVWVYAAYTATLRKFYGTLYKIASFGLFSAEDVAKRGDGTKLMAMACLLHTEWIMPFVERARRLETQQNGLNGKLEEMIGEIAAAKERVEEMKERKNAESSSEMVKAEEKVEELKKWGKKLNETLEKIAGREMMEVETMVKSQFAYILELFKTLDGRLQMCAHFATKSREEEGRKAQVEAWMELAAMPKARDIPETAHRGFGLFLYQMYLDRL